MVLGGLPQVAVLDGVDRDGCTATVDNILSDIPGILRRGIVLHMVKTMIIHECFVRQKIRKLSNEEPCKIRHQWQHLTHKVLTTCIVTRML